MKDQTMKHEQITAWALDELSPQEREQIEATLHENPQIKASAEETKSFCDLLITELRDESLELTSEQRSRLQTMPPASNIILPSAASKPVRWRFASRFGSIAAAAACVAVGGYWIYPWPQPQSARLDSQAPVRRFRVSTTPQAVSSPKSGPLAPDGIAMNAPVPAAAPSPLPITLALPQEPPATASRIASEKPLVAVNRVFDPNLPSQLRKSQLTGPESPSFSNGRAVSSGSILVIDASNFAPRNAALPKITMPASESAVADADDHSLRSKQSEPIPSQDNESYTRILENELKDVRAEPLSTFSIDVDTASYANVRRFLNQNMLPPADAVRIEELINYFPSDEEGPAAVAKEPFAARVELAACPWQPHHRLARIAIQGKQVQKGNKASNLVFLVDVSGSMDDPQKLPLVKQSLRLLAEQMGEGDRVSMVTYASGTQVVLPPTNGENRSRVIAAVDQLHAGGSTNGAGGLRLAYEQAVAGFIQEGINRVILCTDGDFNVGISDPTELKKFIAEKARSGVFLSVLGFGSGNLKDRTMETLADKGNGNYAYIDGLAEARKVLVEQMAGTLVTIAKDVKVQIEFNPAQVRAYRLVGYENRLLTKEDFNDDTKDAGEIGSGHRVVALYELVPANLPPSIGPDRLVDTLKYQTLASPTAKDLNETQSAPSDPQTSKELMTVKLRYKQPTGETSSKIELPVTDEGKTLEAASGEFQFSAAVAGFGLLLRDSSYKGTLSWEAVRKLALAGKGADKLGYRGEFLQLIDKAAGLKQITPR